MTAWRLAWRIAQRELRSSAPKFLFAVLGVATGVGALTGVRGFADSFHAELRRQARTLIASDLSLRQFTTPTPAQQAELDAWARRGVRATQITETVSMMAGSTDVPALVSIKAVDPNAYPFYGEVELNPRQPLAKALQNDTVAVSDDLVARLGVQVGSTVHLGAAELRVVGIVASEPDKMTGSLNIGPRVMMSRDAFARTGLMTFGSRGAQRFLFRLPSTGVNIDEIRAALKKAFPEALIADYRESHPAIARALERATTFLSLVSLIALVVGGLGVATSIHAHLQQRLDTIAILKCLGARSQQIISIYTFQAALLGVAGGLGGIVVGYGVQRILPLLMARFAIFDYTLSWSPNFALQGVGVGMLVCLLFSLPTLLSIRTVKPALIFRREMTPAAGTWRNAWKEKIPAVLAGLAIIAGLALVAVYLAESWRVGLYFGAAVVISLLVLAGVAWLLLRVLRWTVRHVPLQWSLEIRHGLANLYRPGNHATAVLVALGVGVMFTLTVYLLQSSLVSEVASAAPPNAPNVIMIDITPREHDAVERMLNALPNLQSKPILQPLVSVRLLTIDGKPVQDLQLQGFDKRHQNTRMVSWEETAPADLVARSGQWWTKEQTEPQVAVVEETAQLLHLHVGSKLRWTAIGRDFDTRVAAVFRQRAVRTGPQMELLFNKPALDGLPTQYVGLVKLKAPQIAQLQRESYRQFPTVVVINRADVMDLVQQVIDRVAIVIRFIAAFAILAGAIILASTVAGTRQRRIRETAVLKTLGAKRARLIGIFTVEFFVLGTVAGAMGGALASIFTRVLMTRLLEAEFRFAWTPVLLTTVMTAALAIAAGWIASARILTQRPLEVLRGE